MHPADGGVRDLFDDGESTEVLDAGPPRKRHPTVLRVTGALVVAAALAVAIRHGSHDGDATSAARSDVTPSPTATQAPDLTLTPLRRYAVSGVRVGAAGQSLRVDYEPTPTSRIDGGTVTLYAPCCFAARSFTPTATRAVVQGHVAYFGRYEHQFSLAWPVSGGRWVCLSGFLGSGNGTDPDVSRAAELTVATAVVVR